MCISSPALHSIDQMMPQNWTEFLSLDTAQFNKLKKEMLRLLTKLSNDDVDRLLFNTHYLALYRSFDIKDSVPFEMNKDVLIAIFTLLSRHSFMIKNATFLIRMEWHDIATILDARKKRNKHRPQSPWGAVPSLSTPADPTKFAQYVWPTFPWPFQEVESDIKQCFQSQYEQQLKAEELTVVYLKAMDVAAIMTYGLRRMDEQDTWLVRYYQQYGYLLLRYNNIQKSDNNESESEEKTNTENQVQNYCALKLCAKYHRICLLMHLHGKWTEDVLMMEKHAQKTSEQDEEKHADDNDTAASDKGLRFLNYVRSYLGYEYNTEIALHDIGHIQKLHIDFWASMSDEKVEQLLNRQKRASSMEEEEEEQADVDVDEILKRYQDIGQFFDDMNETRAEFCGEFVCGLLSSSDIAKIEKDALSLKSNKKVIGSKLQHPTLLANDGDNVGSNDLNALSTKLHTQLFHGYSLMHTLKEHRIKAFKINPDRVRRQEAAIRIEIQNKMRQKMQAKMRQRTM